MIDPAELHFFLRYSHIGVGTFALLVFWVTVFSKKGSRFHIRCGRVFLFCGYWVVATAAISCIWAFITPISFQTMHGAKPEVAAQYVDDLQFLFSILGFLAANVFAGLRMGVRLVQTKEAPEQLATYGLRTAVVVSGVLGVALILFGLWHIRFAGLWSRYLVCIALGLLGVAECRSSLKFLATPRPTPMAWLYKHMECMLGCGIGFHTAFLVFGASRLIPAEWLAGPWRLLPWLIPAMIGIPAISIWQKHYRRKFGEIDD